MKDYANGHAATMSFVLVTNLATGSRRGELDKVEIYFHDIPDEVIDKLIEEGIVLYAAGGWIVEHPLIFPYIKEVVGSADRVMFFLHLYFLLTLQGTSFKVFGV